MVVLEATRIRLNGWQNVAVAVGSSVGAIMDPGRADLVAAMGETTGKFAFQRVRQRMKETPEGRAVLSERPRIISQNIKHAGPVHRGRRRRAVVRSHAFSRGT